MLPLEARRPRLGRNGSEGKAGGAGPCYWTQRRGRAATGPRAEDLWEDDELLPLPLPRQRKPVQQIIQLQLRRLPSVQDRFHDFRRQQREPQNPTDIGRIHALPETTVNPSR